ncbi:MAG: hypothetical protein HETSPECPRED_009983 [Heterodermia speciosa]|uniref:Biotrophy-associated secreted protein 2 n=1 Tax=Heterodermia speciosa TaxID=116794 RepID=A0A8H3G3I8_9LECA|nr:MAG: hypothetical protein HETSPECPRED_009983 [Heterodermia speciosa]
MKTSPACFLPLLLAFLHIPLLTSASPNPLPIPFPLPVAFPAPAGTQFITGVCASDADCASGCCGFRSGKCAGAVIAQERDGGCGFGDPKPNNNAAVALGSSEAAAGVVSGGAGAATQPTTNAAVGGQQGQVIIGGKTACSFVA